MKSVDARPATIDDYITGFAPDVQSILSKIREVIRAAAPDAEESISYGMPAFRLNGVLVYFAAFKKHIGMYPPIDAGKLLNQALKKYRGPKGNLQFPLDQPIPYELIKKLVLFRVKQNQSIATARQSKTPVRGSKG